MNIFRRNTMKTITKTLASILLTASIIGVASAQTDSLVINLSANVPDTSAPYYTVNVGSSALQFAYDVAQADFTGDSTPVTVNVASGELTALTAYTSSPTSITNATDPTKSISYEVNFGTKTLTSSPQDVVSELGAPGGVSIVTLAIDPEAYSSAKHVEGNYSGNLNINFDGTLS